MKQGTIEIPEGLEGCVELKGKGVRVNFGKLVKLKKEVTYGNIDLETFNQISDRFLEFLKSLRRLTYQKISSFYLSCGGVDFGPKFSWGQDTFSFSERKDAEDYAKAFGSCSLLPVDLYRVAGDGMYEILKRGVNKN